MRTDKKACCEFKCCRMMESRIMSYMEYKETQNTKKKRRISSIVYDNRYRSYNISTLDTEGLDAITFCPWCGTSLPKEIDPYVTIMKEYGADYVRYSSDPLFKELSPEVQKEFESDEWWKKRHIGPDENGL